MSLFFTHALLNSGELSRLILLAMAVFWFLRLLIQLFVYDSSLWQGNRLYTFVHFAFVIFWTSLSGVYAAALIRLR